jgi:predicted CXXCH cytochrome family protein
VGPPVEVGQRSERYVTSDACRACHPGAYATWHASFHRTMTQIATRSAVLGAFDGRRLGQKGQHRVGWDDGVPWVEWPDADGRLRRDPVVLVTGSHHMQVYWVRPEPDDGRLVAFDFAWLIPEAQWVPNESTLLRPPDQGGEAVTYTWNRVCIKCHAVAGAPGYEPSTGTVQSGVVELGIACEACHGPAREHVRRHRNPWLRYAARLGAEPDDSIVHPGRLPADAASQICAQCHSISVFTDDDAWVRRGHGAAPPDPVEAWGAVVRHPVRADQPLAEALLDDDPDYFAHSFWPDGMVRVSGREYNGILESACARSPDLGCGSCHRMHGSDPDDQLVSVDPDAPCRGCHAAQTEAAGAHTHHAPESVGSRCVNCHMPHTTYGLLKAIRSHQIGSPSVAEDEHAGRPNACNLCHVDRTARWAADALTAWYGQPSPELPDEIAPAGLRWLLAGDAGQRALAAWHFGWADAGEAAGVGWQTPWLAHLLDDPYPAVRWVAYRALRRQPGLAGLELGSLERVDPATIASLQTDPQFDRHLVDALVARRDHRPISLAE